eukprot:jgi/Botrbrau1/14597/Bobra.242_2s0007.1
MKSDQGTLQLPPDLKSVPTKVLETYVRNKIIQFLGEAAFAEQVHMSTEALQGIAARVLDELSRPPELESGDVQYKLRFRHECLSLGCLDMECVMCKQTPHRKCRNSFAAKYLSGDMIKGKCGAPIYVDVLDPSIGQPVAGNRLTDYHLEICILEGKAYSELNPETATDEEIDACVHLTNNHGKELLAPGKGSEYSEDKKIVTRFVNGKAELSLSILGSSIALLSGQKPSFRFLVRVVQTSTGQRAKQFGHGVSDAFVVATQRVKTAQKAEIPHVEEHVSKIEYVGLQTQNKLLDIRAAAAAVSIMGLNVVHNTITTVGQFKDLMESCEKDIPLQETLKKVLNFTAKGWAVAREHALRAVSTDNRMRIWCSDDKLSTGLLFKCHLGRIDLESPVGLLKKAAIEGGHVTMEAVLPGSQTDYDRQMVERLQRQAVKCWYQPGHPGWSIWPADSEQFVQGVCSAQPGAVAPGPVQIVAPVPTTLTSGNPPPRNGFGVGSARLPPPTFGTQQEPPKLPRVTAPPPFRLPMEQVLPGHHITAEDPVRLSRNNGWNAQTSYSKSAPGVHVDKSQLVPSPFDVLRETPGVPPAVPQPTSNSRNHKRNSSMDMPALPSTLPILNSADLASLSELQNTLNSKGGTVSLSQLPQLCSKLSGLLNEMGGALKQQGSTGMLTDVERCFPAKVSGALEDITGALAMIQDLLPSVQSETHINLYQAAANAANNNCSQQNRDLPGPRLTRRNSGLQQKRGAGGVAQGLVQEIRGKQKLRKQNSFSDTGGPRIRTRNSKQFD